MEKIAFIEINNYMAKLIIAETKTNAMFNIITKRVVPVDLGQDFEKDHFFKRPQIDNAIEVLKQFKQTCNMYGVEKSHTIGTFLSELKPKNFNSFVDEVYTKCGFKLDFCDEIEQSNALFKATIATVDSNKAFACLLEQDSLRLVQYNRRGVVNYATFSFGPITLLQNFSKEEYSEDKRIEAISSYIDAQLKTIEWVEEVKQLKFVGVGRYFEDLSKMVMKYKKYPFNRSHLYEMEKEDMEHIINQVLQMGLDDTKKLKNLDDGRVDAFVVALTIMQKLFALFETEKVIISKNGVLEGRILEKSIVLNQEKPIIDILELGISGAIISLEERQQQHAKQVSNLSSIIFRELKVVHKLPKAYLKVLKVAGALHDLGYVINYYKHSAHSAYAILNKEILGLTHREQILASFVASLHHGEEIDIATWIKYQGLFEEDDALAVKKLGTMLRLAECFDIGMNNTITDIHCDILGDSVIFKTESEGDKSFELSEARLMEKSFEQLFKKRLEIL